MSEVARALRALSSCYVERRDKLAEGGALSSKGKRAAFALFYGPQHLLITREILKALPAAHRTHHRSDRSRLRNRCRRRRMGAGCGVAVDSRLRSSPVGDCGGELDLPTVSAAWPGDAGEHRGAWNARTSGLGLESRRGTAVLAAYAANELAPDGRAVLLTSLLEAHAQGARVLVIEPIARRSLPWWRGLAGRRRARRRSRRRVAIPRRSPADPARARASRGTGPPGAHRTLAFPVALRRAPRQPPTGV